jgi:hypothetical protein
VIGSARPPGGGSKHIAEYLRHAADGGQWRRHADYLFCVLFAITPFEPRGALIGGYRVSQIQALTTFRDRVA